MIRLFIVLTVFILALVQPVFFVRAADAPEAGDTAPLVEFRLISPDSFMASGNLAAYLQAGNDIKSFPGTPEGKEFVVLNEQYYLIDKSGVVLTQLQEVALEEIPRFQPGVGPLPGETAVTAQILKLKLRAADRRKLAEYAPVEACSRVLVFLLGQPIAAIDMQEPIVQEGEVKLMEPRLDMKALAEQLQQTQQGAAKPKKTHRK